ncbi:hypothetical protein KZC51_02050 [Microbacterium sp. SSW1-49]|uniref:Uncharacterized protein n=1 Tax=Microbacterium croceum TaxID=2851645 RepID=A0ABT0FB08_9MICO|nr:hypothetical protein [Microbacterium croceum]MCK2034907.1 hypothetical protein [Microbacterium croceum]
MTRGQKTADRRVRESYSARAAEYTALLGDMSHSVIHADADELPSLLAAARRLLRTGGHLLLGFFDGPDGEPFAHAVTTAHFWSIRGMTELLEGAGFSVVDGEARIQEGRRPHASISAVAV